MKTYKIYGLIDPRNNSICYIGMTTQNPKKRLRQHRSPIKSNESKIAKLQRHLIKKGMTLDIVILYDCSSKEEMYSKEIEIIKFYKDNNHKLYNLQEGGLNTANPKFSLLKGVKTRNKNGNAHNVPKGEECSSSILSNDDVLRIYSLIKKFYSNEEIYELYKDKCKISTIKVLRTGQNWKHLWSLHFTDVINSIKTLETGYNPRIKLKIVDLIKKGYAIEHIHSKFNKISISDLKRISEGKIWKPVVEIYRKNYSAFSKKLLSNNPVNSVELSNETIPSQAE